MQNQATYELTLPRGERSKIASLLGITPGAVSQWRRVPAERVLDVERITGISRHDLRPDIYGPPPTPAPAREGVGA